jgi:hypothetical protein
MDVLPRRLVGDIHEPVLGAAGNADDVARLRIEATTVHFVQVAALEDAKDLRLGMLMPRRPLSRRIDGFDDGERAAARLRRHVDHEIESDRRNCDGRIGAFGMNKRYAHCPNLRPLIQGERCLPLDQVSSKGQTSTTPCATAHGVRDTILIASERSAASITAKPATGKADDRKAEFSL